MHTPPTPSAKPAIAPADNPTPLFRLATTTGRAGRAGSSSRFEGSSLLLEGAALVDPGSMVGAAAFVGSSVGEGGEVTKAIVGKIVVSSTVGDIVGIEKCDGDEEGSRLAASTVEVGGSVEGDGVGAGVIGSAASLEEIEGNLVGAEVGGISIGVIVGHLVSERRKYAL
jgi:hypothetical protein